MSYSAPPTASVPAAGPPPPGMVAVPAAALSGRKQHAAQQAGQNIGMMGGLVAGAEGAGGSTTGADMVGGMVAGGFIGQQIGRYERQAAMRDPNAPMVYVDEDSRAGRRAVRRQGRKERRQNGGWLSRIFGIGGGKAAEERKAREGDEESETVEAQG